MTCAYFYLWDEDWPGVPQGLRLLPLSRQDLGQRHDWARRQAVKAGIGFTGLSNGFASYLDLGRPENVEIIFGRPLHPRPDDLRPAQAPPRQPHQAHRGTRRHSCGRSGFPGRSPGGYDDACRRLKTYVDGLGMAINGEAQRARQLHEGKGHDRTLRESRRHQQAGERIVTESNLKDLKEEKEKQAQ